MENSKNFEKGGTTMKSWVRRGMLAAAIALPALSGVARAQSNDGDGCTNATLRGDYAFSVTNFTLPSVVVGIVRWQRPIHSGRLSRR
jgi:hypothetical protein